MTVPLVVGFGESLIRECPAGECLRRRAVFVVGQKGVRRQTSAKWQSPLAPAGSIMWAVPATDARFFWSFPVPITGPLRLPSVARQHWNFSLASGCFYWTRPVQLLTSRPFQGDKTDNTNFHPFIAWTLYADSNWNLSLIKFCPIACFPFWTLKCYWFIRDCLTFSSASPRCRRDSLVGTCSCHRKMGMPLCRPRCISLLSTSIACVPSTTIGLRPNSMPCWHWSSSGLHLPSPISSSS